MKIGIVHVTLEGRPGPHTDLITQTLGAATCDVTELVNRQVRQKRRPTDDAPAFSDASEQVGLRGGVLGLSARPHRRRRSGS